MFSHKIIDDGSLQFLHFNYLIEDELGVTITFANSI